MHTSIPMPSAVALAALILLTPLTSALTLPQIDSKLPSESWPEACRTLISQAIESCKDGISASDPCSDQVCLAALADMSAEARTACAGVDNEYVQLIQSGPILTEICRDSGSLLGPILNRRQSTPKVATATIIPSPTFRPTPTPLPPLASEEKSIEFSGFMTVTWMTGKAMQRELVTDSPKASTSTAAESATPTQSAGVTAGSRKDKVDLVIDDGMLPGVRNGDGGSGALAIQSNYVIEGAASQVPTSLPTGKSVSSSLKSSDEGTSGSLSTNSMGGAEHLEIVGGVWGVMAFAGAVAMVMA